MLPISPFYNNSNLHAYNAEAEFYGKFDLHQVIDTSKTKSSAKPVPQINTSVQPKANANGQVVNPTKKKDSIVTAKPITGAIPKKVTDTVNAVSVAVQTQTAAPIDPTIARSEYELLHPFVVDSNAVIRSDTIVRAIVSPAVEIIRSSEEEAEVALPNFFFTEFSPELKAKPRIIDPDAWILPVLLLSFFFLAIVNTLYNREIKNILASLVKSEGIKKIAEHENTMVWRSLLLLLLLFLLVSPVFLFQTSEFFHLSTAFLPYLSPYFQLMLIGAGLLGLKILMIGFIGNLFYVQLEAARYITGIVVMNSLLAALIIPLSLGIKLSGETYTEYILVTGLVLFALCYLYSIVNGLLAGLRSSTLSKFHLFLYFCTLEILPVFIIIKTVRTLI